jgi:NADH-quinone oxidoreductase subunit L
MRPRRRFITNRLGDFGFILGILILWVTLGTVNFDELQQYGRQSRRAGAGHLAGLLIFCGAMGKSAQFPLHVWLPDAMEGPTPVSALIHAATMVAAGVYMLCRVFFIFTPAWPDFVLSRGRARHHSLAGSRAHCRADGGSAERHQTHPRLLDALAARLHGHGGRAVRGPDAGMFHLTTHAFFKALLFLGAGSVIHACTTSRTSGKWAACKKDARDVLDVHGRHAGVVRACRR